MVYIILLVMAVALALPTYGLSLLAFFLMTNYLNKLAARPIIDAMYRSYESGKVVELPYRDSATIKKAFKLLNVDDYEEERFPSANLKTFSGAVQHPKHPNPLFVQIHFARQSGSPNAITVSADDISTSAPVVAMKSMIEKIDREIKERNSKG